MLMISILITVLILPNFYSVTSAYTLASRKTSQEPSSPSSIAQIPALIEGAPAPQKERIIVILAELADVSNSTSVSAINSTVFQIMASYYDEVSYHEMALTGNTTNWIPMPNDTVQYGHDMGVVDPDSWWLIRDIIEMTDNSTNFANYDVVIVVHSGGDQAASSISNDIWSAYWSGLDIPTNDGVTITNGIVVSEQDPMGIFAHEFGHSLGLPDLYNTDGGGEYVGKWDLMAEGAWLGTPQGTSPSHLTSWCKIQMGWISANASLVGRIDQGVIDPLETNGNNFTVMKIPVTTDTCYLVEVRQKIHYDSYLPATGVLILYCDETRASGEGIVTVKYSQSLTMATYTTAPGNNIYTDGGRNINITVLSAYSQSYRVSVGLINPDNTPPNIDLRYPVPGTWPSTQPATVRAVITDTGTDSSSVRNATLLYSSDELRTWNRIQMSAGSGDLYSAVIPRQNSSQVYYYVEAYDYAGNLAIANNSGNYYAYGRVEETITVLALSIIFIGLASGMVAVFWQRKSRPKEEAQPAMKLET